MVTSVKDTTKGFAKRPFKLIQSEEEQIRSFLDYQASLLSSLGCPTNAIKSYVGTLGIRIRSERAGFLKLLKDLFIQGVKILGDDTPIFHGWKIKGRFPRLYHWVFTELATLNQQWSATPSQVKRARGLLSVLYGARSLKLQHSVSALNKALDDFKTRVLKKNADSVLAQAGNTLEKAKRKFGPVFSDSMTNGSQFDLSRRSQKPNKLWQGEEFRLPEKVFEAQRLADYANGVEPLVNNAFVRKGPIGKVTVLTEKAGKTRVICGYNGYVNASDLSLRARSILDVHEKDASKDQTLGHIHALKLSALAEHMIEKSYVPELDWSTMMFRTQPANSAPKPKGLNLFRMFAGGKKTTAEVTVKADPVLLGKKILSADLSAFTDSISYGTWVGMLAYLGCNNLHSLLFSGEVILPTGEAIKPNTVLMGLKGCFDVASLVHHICLPEEVDYRIVGDDFVGIIPPEIYEQLVGTVGLELNRSKTVYSKDTSVFCGKVYKTGADISPFVPSFFTMCGSSVASAVDSAKDALDRGYLFPNQFRSIVRFVKTKVLSRLKCRVSFDLPSKLGGFHTRNGPSRSLLDVLDERWQHFIASVSVPVSSLDPETISRNSLPGFPCLGIKVLPWTELYLAGGQKLPRKVKLCSPNKSGDLLGLGLILEYYYGLIAAAP